MEDFDLVLAGAHLVDPAQGRDGLFGVAVRATWARWPWATPPMSLVLHDERGCWALRDNEGTQRVGERLLRTAFCLRDGVRFEADATILPLVRPA